MVSVRLPGWTSDSVSVPSATANGSPRVNSRVSFMVGVEIAALIRTRPAQTHLTLCGQRLSSISTSGVT